MVEGTFTLHNLMIARDLNFIWSANEVWFQRAKLDPLNSLFSDLFEKVEMVDVEHIPLSPTRTNGWASVDEIAK